MSTRPLFFKINRYLGKERIWSAEVFYALLINYIPSFRPQKGGHEKGVVFHPQVSTFICMQVPNLQVYCLNVLFVALAWPLCIIKSGYIKLFSDVEPQSYNYTFLIALSMQ